MQQILIPQLARRSPGPWGRIAAAARFAGSGAKRPERLTDAGLIRAAQDRFTLVSTPHPVSRIRQLRPQIVPEATLAAKTRNEYMQSCISFHHEFWTRQNTAFHAAHQAFISETSQKTGRSPTTAELNAFYARHLSQTSGEHVEYSLRWWRRAIKLLGLSLSSTFASFSAGLQRTKKSQTGDSRVIG